MFADPFTLASYTEPSSVLGGFSSNTTAWWQKTRSEHFINQLLGMVMADPLALVGATMFLV
jgi:hypothetical protein